MGKFQKFMFDNFIIKANDEPAEETVPETEPLQEETIAEWVEEKAPEFVPEPEIIDVPVEEVHEPVPETVSYSEDELKSAVEAAHQEGYAKGRESALDEQQNALAALEENIGNRLSVLLADKDGEEKRSEQKLLSLCKDMLQKLFPVMEEKYALDTVKDFLGHNFSNFAGSSKLAFYFNPAIIQDIQETIARLAKSYDFEGKISLHKDASLSLSDCRVEWENGGVEKKQDKVLAKMNELIENSGTAENTEE